MKIECIPADQLTGEQVSVWSRLQLDEVLLGNPSFSPEFTQAVAAVRDDVEVAVLSQHGRYVGFLPFQRAAKKIGLPVGSVLTDMHGLIGEPNLQWDPVDVLRQCNLSSWRFDHLLANQQPFAPHIRCVEESPYMDLSQGYEAYVAERRNAGSSSVKRVRSKANKLQRECGPLRFVFSDNIDERFDQVLGWKRQQIAQMGFDDIFRDTWVVDLLRRVAETQTQEFSGMISSLYAGDQLIAAQIGMRSRDVLSSWIPTFNSEFGKYSPGLLLHLEMAQAAAAIGIRRIDLGRGNNQLKTSLRSNGIGLGLGEVNLRPINRFIRQSWYTARNLVYATPLRGLPLRYYRRVRRWLT